jgi:hypothetical protein
MVDDTEDESHSYGWAERSWRWCRRKPAAAALLGALLALVLLTAGGGLWLERKQAVEAALLRFPDLRRQSRWTEVETVLTQARSRLADADSDDPGRQLAKAEADLELATALERLRLTPTIAAGGFDYHGMVAAYARTFEHAGMDVWGDEKTVAGRIHGSDLRPQLIMALDHWAFVANALDDQRSLERLLGLARRVAPGPEWGDRVRTPKLWLDPAAIGRLAAEAERRLAESGPEQGPRPFRSLATGQRGAEGAAGGHDSFCRQSIGSFPCFAVSWVSASSRL